MGTTANALSVNLQPFEIYAPTELESAFATSVNKHISALVVVDHAFFIDNADAITALAVRHRIPCAGTLELAASGGLIGYGVNFVDMFRRASVFVDKILKGDKPGDIPIEQATKFKFVLNLKTANAIGVTFLLARTDEVIE
jgi:putative tryptophan/tyrosine transport system substrate-binding protein